MVSKLRKVRIKQYIFLCIVVSFLGCFTFNKMSLQYSGTSIELIENIMESTNKLVINPYPSKVQIIRGPLNVCDSLHKKDDSIIIAIKSYIGDFDQRLAIRNTWGNITHQSIKILFFVGDTTYAMQLLNEEYHLYSDIVQGSFSDKYDNNIFKTLMIFKWISQNCMGAKYVLLVDDDYFVNLKNLISFIDFVEGFPTNPLWMVGNKCYWCTPRRNPNSKWYVSYKQYKFFFWPTYFHGGSIFTTPEVLKKMITIAPHVDHFHIDDIYIGMLAHVLRLNLHHQKKFAHYPVSIKSLAQVITSHGYSGRFKLVNAWDAFVKQSITENTFKQSV